MKKDLVAVLLVLSVITVALSSAATAESGAEGVRLLVIDETKTFASTMRVAALVGALRQVGVFEVDVILADVETSYSNPLEGKTSDRDKKPYDILLILPLGLDDGSVEQIWVVSNGLDLLPQQVRFAVNILSQVVDQVFAGIGTAIDVYQDLFPAFLWALYTTGGWIR